VRNSKTPTKTANATFSVEEAEADFDVNADDEIETTAEENATVSGTTNVAPSTEFSVRLRSTDDTSPRFTLTDDEVTVNADGTFEASFDLSGQAVNDTFDGHVPSGCLRRPGRRRRCHR